MNICKQCVKILNYDVKSYFFPTRPYGGGGALSRTPSEPQASHAHALVYMIQPRADARHPNAYRKPKGRDLDALHNACASKRREACERPTKEPAPVLRRVRRSACCGRTYGPSHLHFAEACQLDTCASVLRIPPNGKQRCGGARSTGAVGANGIERCPPHVYP